MEQQRWAAAHYRVERESSGLVMRKRQRRKATEQAIQYGDPVPHEPHDVVRILDREGEVVFEQDWATNRSGAMAHEAQIVEDLLRLDVLSFRAKYGVTSLEEIKPPEEAEVPGAPEVAAEPDAEPDGPPGAGSG